MQAEHAVHAVQAVHVVQAKQAEQILRAQGLRAGTVRHGVGNAACHSATACAFHKNLKDKNVGDHLHRKVRLKLWPLLAGRLAGAVTKERGKEGFRGRGRRKSIFPSPGRGGAKGGGRGGAGARHARRRGEAAAAPARQAASAPMSHLEGICMF